MFTFVRLAAGALLLFLPACGTTSFTIANDDGGGAASDGGDGGGGDSGSGSDGGNAGDAGTDGGSGSRVLPCPGAPFDACDRGAACCEYKSTSSGYVGACTTTGSCSGSPPTGAQGSATSMLRCTRSSQCGSGNICCIAKVGGVPTSSCAHPSDCTSNAFVCEMGTQGGCGLSDAGSSCSNSASADWAPTTLGTCGGVAPR